MGSPSRHVHFFENRAASLWDEEDENDPSVTCANVVPRMTSRDSAMTSRDSAMMSRDSMMTSRRDSSTPYVNMFDLCETCVDPGESEICEVESQGWKVFSNPYQIVSCV